MVLLPDEGIPQVKAKAAAPLPTLLIHR